MNMDRRKVVEGVCSSNRVEQANLQSAIRNPQCPERRGTLSYLGLRIVILGLARQGSATARFFLKHGAHVTVSDLRTAGQLAATCTDLQNYAEKHASAGASALHFALGGHPLTLLDGCDLLCLSGGVSPGIPLVRAAVERGIPLRNDGQLTLHHCPVPIIGITGSAGKTTTTTLVGLMLERAGFTVHMGGNIGAPLLDKLETIGPGHKVVMELSSFQLELFDRLCHSPAIAAILNITPNHLDRHPSMSHYAAAKANILRFQEPGDVCVLNADDAYTSPWLTSGRCRIAAGEGQEAVYFPLRADRLGFTLKGEVAAGAFLQARPFEALIWRRPGLGDVEICRPRDVRLRGRHNLANVLAACCIAGAAGATAAAMAQVATTFGGVEHRLEIVRQRDGVLWVNDSIATAPERTVAALRSFCEPIVLLAGGRDKHLPWDECAAVMHEQCRHVVLFGEAAGLIADALTRRQRETAASLVPATFCADLPAAVATAAAVARSGDVVLLAPGGTSFDAYEDFAARGRHFRALVEELP
jgi:UDP-N-acetylmuramoylalanine--D-glutamate ligase